MNFLPRARSISAQLVRMNLLVTGTALVLACIAFFTYDLVSFQHGLIRNLSSSAAIVGSNSVSALVFNDADAAQKTLAALNSSPDILNASILMPDGRVFAQYNATSARPPTHFPHLAKGRMLQSWISGRNVVLAQRIVFQGKNQGTVYLFARLQEIGSRARRYFGIAAVILLFCLMVALATTTAFQQTVAQPLVALANMAAEVSRDRNYSLRAPPSHGSKEVVVLIDSFNEMITQIEHRDRALRQARDLLEERVRERTAALENANRELEAFSYTVAHDLRGPLDAIGGIGFLLHASYSPHLDAEGREMLERLRNSVAKMTTLIDDLLNLSRADSANLTWTSVDLTAMACAIAEELQASAPDRHAAFTIAPGAVVQADRGLMQVVLENLLRNAWKYSSNRSVIEIEFGFKVSDHETVLFVRDNGDGFNPELQERLYQPFQRLHTQAEFSGTGIGLATVKRIAGRHGGRVWAEGAVGRGATFYFALPLRSPAAAFCVDATDRDSDRPRIPEGAQS